jgi:hypothetical protein
MSEGYSKHSKFEHVFAIVRVATEGPYSWEDRVYVTKIVRDENTAQREVERLNKLNARTGSLYFWQITRMELLGQNKPTGKKSRKE